MAELGVVEEEGGLGGCGLLEGDGGGLAQAVVGYAEGADLAAVMEVVSWRWDKVRRGERGRSVVGLTRS